VGCCIWYNEEGTGRGRSPPRPLVAVPHVTAHASTASVLVSSHHIAYCIMVHYSADFNVSIKGLNNVQGLLSMHGVASL